MLLEITEADDQGHARDFIVIDAARPELRLALVAKIVSDTFPQPHGYVFELSPAGLMFNHKRVEGRITSRGTYLFEAIADPR